MKISIVIIGYNTAENLKELLVSLKKIKLNKDLFEIIYVDDGSLDSSVNIYKSCNLKIVKKHYHFKTNRGRVVATSKGVELASGEWILFLQSNVIVDSNVLKEYIKIISKKRALAFVGQIIYESGDLRFQNYLNHKKRGLNSAKNNSLINYENLLFGNCLIKKIVFKNICLNLDLKYYGGEELDFAYNLNQLYPHMMRYNQKSIVIRKSHPKLKEHLLRLYEFGATNLLLLNRPLQKKIIQFEFLLNNNWANRTLIEILNCLLFAIFKIKIKKIDFLIIRGLLLCSIMRGYYSSK